MADSTGRGARPPFRLPLGLRIASAAAAIWVAAPALAEPSDGAGTCRVAWSADRLGPFAQGAFRLAGGGGLARLVDLRLAEGGPAEARALAVLAGLAGEEVSVGAVGEADRWERVPALVRIGRARPVDLAELLVGEGFAAVDAGEREALCRPELLATERAARRDRRGLWAGDGAVLQARDAAALAAAAGRFVLVEGRIASVGVRRDRTYLNFGRDFARDFAVVMPRRIWGTVQARGYTADTLRGATVRVRGFVETRRAPALDLNAADMLEVVAPRRPPAAGTRLQNDRRDDP